MSGVSIALLVFFIIVAFLIVGLVLLQNEEGDSLGGLFSGGSNSAFGSRSGNILTRATYTLITLFFVVTFFLAWLNKSPGDSGLQQDAQINSNGMVERERFRFRQNRYYGKYRNRSSIFRRGGS